MQTRRQASARGGRFAAASEPTPGGAADDTPDADPESVARAIVLRQLTMAPRSRAQLADKLAERGAPADVAQRVLDRFEEVGLIDDVAFAEMLVRSQQASRGLGRRGLAHELRRKGVDDETAALALEQVDDEAELEAAQGAGAAPDRVHQRARAGPADGPAGRHARAQGLPVRPDDAGGLARRIDSDEAEPA